MVVELAEGVIEGAVGVRGVCAESVVEGLCAQEACVLVACFNDAIGVEEECVSGVEGAFTAGGVEWVGDAEGEAGVTGEGAWLVTG